MDRPDSVAGCKRTTTVRARNTNLITRPTNCLIMNQSRSPTSHVATHTTFRISLPYYPRVSGQRSLHDPFFQHATNRQCPAQPRQVDLIRLVLGVRASRHPCWCHVDQQGPSFPSHLLPPGNKLLITTYA